MSTAEATKRKTLSEVIANPNDEIQLIEMACRQLSRNPPEGAKIVRVRRLLKIIRRELAYARGKLQECPDCEVETWSLLLGIYAIKLHLGSFKNDYVRPSEKAEKYDLESAEHLVDRNVRRRGISEYSEVPFAYIKGDARKRALCLYKEYGVDINSRIIASMRGDYCFHVYEVVPVDTEKIAFLSPLEGYYVVGVGTILLQWRAFLIFFGWTPGLIRDMAILPRKIEAQNDMHSDLYDMAVDFHLCAEEGWADGGLCAFLRRRSEWEATDIKNKAGFMQAGLDSALAIRLGEDILLSLYKSAGDDFKPFCQIPFAWWAESGIAQDYGFEKSTKRIAILRGKEMPVFPIRPWLYMHSSGAFADLESSVVIGRYSELQAFLFDFGYADLFRAPDSALMPFFRRA